MLFRSAHHDSVFRLVYTAGIVFGRPARPTRISFTDTSTVVLWLRSSAFVVINDLIPPSIQPVIRDFKEKINAMVSSQVLPKEPLKLLAKKREEKVLFFNFLLILGGLEKMKNVTNSKKMSIYNCQKIGQKSYLKRGLLLKLSSGYHLEPSKHDGQQHVNYRYPMFSKSPYLQLCKSTDEQQKDVVFVCAGNSLRFVSEY